MNESKIQTITKIFENDNIRTIWSSEEEKYYISIIDVVGILSESEVPRKYWNWLKNKIRKDDGFEVSSITRHFK